ncbi:MAG: hypothetical protein R8G34_10160 [Paracoccaceae bacterium]|nr:hypothetical protein [Paracoccaceae bacterium]
MLVISPFLAGCDFGFLKVPPFSTKTRKSLLYLTPVCAMFSVAVHIPIINAREGELVPEKQLAALEAAIEALERQVNGSTQQSTEQKEHLADLRDVKLVFDQDGAYGAMNFSLFWSGPGDLDLSLVCPSGEIVAYMNKINCGASLDIDSGFWSSSTEHVENIYLSESAPNGQYSVNVTHYVSTNEAKDASVRFSLMVYRVGNDDIHVISKIADDIQPREAQRVFVFSLPEMLAH